MKNVLSMSASVNIFTLLFSKATQILILRNFCNIQLSHASQFEVQ